MAQPLEAPVIEFQLLDPQTAPEAARQGLEAAQKKLGFVPNMYAVMAHSPAAFNGYNAIYEAFRSQTTFNAHEQEVILLTISHENACHYCMAAHSTLADMSKVPAEVTEALRNGREIPDAKLNVLSKFTRTLVEKRGWASEGDVAELLDAGYTRQNVLDIVAAIAAKTISNYSNHIAQTPVDSAFEQRSWSK